MESLRLWALPMNGKDGTRRGTIIFLLAGILVPAIFLTNSESILLILTIVANGCRYLIMGIVGSLRLVSMRGGPLIEMADGYGEAENTSGLVTNHGDGLHIITADGHS